MKSFVTVAVTTSYRNKNWELKLRREGNDMDSKFWNQGSGMIDSRFKDVFAPTIVHSLEVYSYIIKQIIEAQAIWNSKANLAK
jgi:hypothetical protein